MAASELALSLGSRSRAKALHHHHAEAIVCIYGAKRVCRACRDIRVWGFIVCIYGA